MLISQTKLLWSTQAAEEVALGWILALPGGQAGWPWLPTCPAGAAASGDSSWLREVLEEPKKPAPPVQTDALARGLALFLLQGPLRNTHPTQAREEGFMHP